jgi:hypothetical protein
MNLSALQGAYNPAAVPVIKDFARSEKPHAEQALT